MSPHLITGSSSSVSQVVQFLTAMVTDLAITFVGLKSLLTIAISGYCIRLILHGVIRS